MEEEKKEMSSSEVPAEGTGAKVEHAGVQMSESKKFNLSVLFFGLVGALVVVLFLFYVGLSAQVRKLSSNPMVIRAATVLHLPAVKVNGETLTYVDYLNDVSSLKKLSSNPSFSFGTTSDQDISDLVVANFFTTAKVHEIAKKYNVTVTPEEVENKRKELVAQFGEEDVKKSIQENYGWDVETFLKKIIEPSLLNTKVKEAFEGDTQGTEGAEFSREEANVSHILLKVDDPNNVKAKAEQKKKALMVLARLKKGEDFATLAKQFSDDGSKDNGGSLGWVPRGATVESFDKVAFALEAGKISDIVESTYGFHIIKGGEKRTVHDFEKYIESEVKKMQPKFYIPIHNPLDTFAAQAAPQADPNQDMAAPADAAPAPTK